MGGNQGTRSRWSNLWNKSSQWGGGGHITFWGKGSCQMEGHHKKKKKRRMRKKRKKEIRKCNKDKWNKGKKKSWTKTEKKGLMTSQIDIFSSVTGKHK